MKDEREKDWVQGEFYFDVLGEVPYEYIEHPQCDNDVLLNAQYEYIVRGDRTAFSVLWVKFRTLCYKAIYKAIRARQLHCFTKEDIDDMAECAAEYVMRRYSKYRLKYGKEYVIRNFIKGAHDAAMHALWSPSVRDKYSELCNKAEGKSIDFDCSIREGMICD